MELMRQQSKAIALAYDEAPASGAAPINKLPVELLEMIAEEYLSDHWFQGELDAFDRYDEYPNWEKRGCKRLKPVLALRTVARIFAYLTPILKALFKNLRLVAIPEQYKRIRSSNFSTIAPFVQSITFIPPPNNWKLTYDNFLPSKVVPARYKATEKEREAKRKRAYDKYHAYAMAGKALLTNGRLEKVWTNLLKNLCSLRSIRFGRFGIHVLSRSVGGKDMNVYRPETERLVGDACFLVAMRCFIRAGVKPDHIRIASVLSFAEGQVWPVTSTSTGFGEVRTLEFKTRTPQTRPEREEGRYEGRERDQASNDRCVGALDAVLDQCRASLEDLTIKVRVQNTKLAWPRSDAHLAPPHLKCLRLHGCRLQPTEAKKFILSAAQLEQLDLLDCSLSEVLVYAWKDLFDGIRDHSNRLQVSMHPLMVANRNVQISLRYHTGTEVFEAPDRATVKQKEDSSAPDKAEKEELGRYLSRKIEWTPMLDRMFPAL